MAHPYMSQHKASIGKRLARLGAKAGKSYGAASMETKSSYPAKRAGSSTPMTISGGTKGKRADRAPQRYAKGGFIGGSEGLAGDRPFGGSKSGGMGGKKKSKKGSTTNIVVVSGGGGGTPPADRPVPIPVPVGGRPPMPAPPPPGGPPAGPPGPPGPMVMAGGAPAGPMPGTRPAATFKSGGSVKKKGYAQGGTITLQIGGLVPSGGDTSVPDDTPSATSSTTDSPPIPGKSKTQSALEGATNLAQQASGYDPKKKPPEAYAPPLPTYTEPKVPTGPGFNPSEAPYSKKSFKAGGFTGKNINPKAKGLAGPIWHNQGKGYRKDGGLVKRSAGGPASSGVRRLKQSKSAAHITNREG